MPTYVHRCPAGCPGTFEERRSILQAGQHPACPECGAPDCPKAICFDPSVQLLVPTRFGVTIETTGFKGSYGGGGWENETAKYRKWDSSYAGPRAESELPSNER